MNEILISELEYIKLNCWAPSEGQSQSLLINWEKVPLNSFELKIKLPDGDTRDLRYYEKYEVVEIYGDEDIDYSNGAYCLKYTTGKSSSDTSTILIIKPQIVMHEGSLCVDLYVRPEKNDYSGCPDDLVRFNAIGAVRKFNFFVKKLIKEKHQLKKIMPSPDNNSEYKENNTPYTSKPVNLGGSIQIRYIYEPHETKSITRHCEAWGVRGHLRHYKNGKTVFIKPYVKGSGSIKNTIYKI